MAQCLLYLTPEIHTYGISRYVIRSDSHVHDVATDIYLALSSNYISDPRFGLSVVDLRLLILFVQGHNSGSAYVGFLSTTVVVCTF